ncbi:hypothetical protein [Sediminibacter sp. Hel_I_10]|uniref:hypothetical protein n=1 Tax=Sediminibacter sp. Hel_I_10 TaxID=1392490 RepID=UPI00047B3E7F|nr:hypothetical protein [Sediminibacter sp. Hel_I_10]
MTTLSTTVFKINGQFDIYASENTVRYQNYSDLAEEMGLNWKEMSKRARSNFRRKNQENIKPIATNIEAFHITAEVPQIFDEHQLKEATIHHLIFPSSNTIFLKCKNGKTGYSTSNFSITK